MKKGKIRAVIYLISFTAMLTVGIQIYRNIQNYELNKARLVLDVQAALDNGVEAYYADRAKNDIVSFEALFNSTSNNADTLSDDNHITNFVQGSSWVNVQGARSSSADRQARVLDRLNNGGRTVIIGESANIPDSIRGIPLSDYSNISVRIPSEDSLWNFRAFTDQIVLSLSRDTIDFNKMQAFVGQELLRKNLEIPYGLIHYRHDVISGQWGDIEGGDFPLSTRSKSTFMPNHQELEMKFANASLIVLQRGMTDLLISLLITICVVGSLLYLYRIINQQKQLAEVKNDLISNITHEFKTPIATITTAIEGITHFNAERDQSKTDKYLDISSTQLSKLNHMVEKLLETATLDSDKLLLTLEEVDVKEMLHSLSEKYQLIAKDKQICFRTNFESKVVQADLFHLENAISNLIDNAVKYGGKNIEITLAEQHGKMEIKVVDDGQNIEKAQRDKIFDKFYRVPTGNRHDVKGFGIGLYYTKKIIEKHGGSILLNLDSNKTSFEVAI